jgi:exportin-T
LESIIHYATDTSDATVEKVAFGVLNKMVTVWSPTPLNDLSKPFQDLFGTFVIQHLSRVCFEVPSKPSFNSQDAQSRLVLIEIAALQKAIYTMKGEIFCSYLRNNLFLEMGVPANTAEEYIRALQRQDLKQFKKYFVVRFSF